MIKNIQRLTQNFSQLRYSFARYVKRPNEKNIKQEEEEEEIGEQEIKEGKEGVRHEKFIARKIIEKIDGMDLAKELGDVIERRLKAGISFEQIINEGFADIETEKELDSEDKTIKKPLDKDAEDLIKLKKMIDARLDEKIKADPNYLEEMEEMFKNPDFVSKETIEYLEKNKESVENAFNKKTMEKDKKIKKTKIKKIFEE